MGCEKMCCSSKCCCGTLTFCGKLLFFFCAWVVVYGMLGLNETRNRELELLIQLERLKKFHSTNGGSAPPENQNQMVNEKEDAMMKVNPDLVQMDKEVSYVWSLSVLLQNNLTVAKDTMGQLRLSQGEIVGEMNTKLRELEMLEREARLGLSMAVSAKNKWKEKMISRKGEMEKDMAIALERVRKAEEALASVNSVLAKANEMMKWISSQW